MNVIQRASAEKDIGDERVEHSSFQFGYRKQYMLLWSRYARYPWVCETVHMRYEKPLCPGERDHKALESIARRTVKYDEVSANMRENTLR